MARSSKRQPAAPPPEPAVPSAPRPWMMLVFVFVSGAVLMALEITGSRVLAPYFGSTAFVWGSLIGVFLGALSLGYKIGGVLADRYTHRLALAAAGAIAGVLIVVLPAVADDLCAAVMHARLGPRYGPLVASAVLFLLPSVFLGMVSPYAVRLQSEQVETVGNIAGTLYSLSTLGSIAGTILTSFYLIPWLGIRLILVCIGVLEVLAAVGLALTGRRRHVAEVVSVLVATGLIAAGSVRAYLAPMGQVYEADSPYHTVSVHERVEYDGSGRVREMHFSNRYIESAISLTPPYETRARYTNMFQLAWVFERDIRRILIVGCGGGVGPLKFVREHPDVAVDVVEIDPLVRDICEEYFFLEESDRLRVHIEDARLFIRTCADASYDLVILDAFTAGGRIPFHLTTREFIADVHRVLDDRGVLLSNLISGLDGQFGGVFKSEYRTFKDVYPQVYVFPLDYHLSRNKYQSTNVILVGHKSRTALTGTQIVARAEELVRTNTVQRVPQLAELATVLDLAKAKIDLAGYPVLTDDRCPIDLYPNQ